MLREVDSHLWCEFLLQAEGTHQVQYEGQTLYYNPHYKLVHYNSYTGTLNGLRKEKGIQRKQKASIRKLLKKLKK